MINQGKAFVTNAITIILISNMTVQIMQTFTWQFQLVEEGLEATSILASISSPIAVATTGQFGSGAFTGLFTVLVLTGMC